MRKPVQGPEECLAPTSAPLGSKPDLAAKSRRNRLGCHSKVPCTSPGCPLEYPLSTSFPSQPGRVLQPRSQSVFAYLRLEELPESLKTLGRKNPVHLLPSQRPSSASSLSFPTVYIHNPNSVGGGRLTCFSFSVFCFLLAPIPSLCTLPAQAEPLQSSGK